MTCRLYVQETILVLNDNKSKYTTSKRIHIFKRK